MPLEEVNPNSRGFTEVPPQYIITGKYDLLRQLKPRSLPDPYEYNPSVEK
ncbi:uncharacterized protein FTOL_13673 [Fusarium torulosum]|uniref:Uncharacterized protein n=1 Tax=Fusarium torulosum TaxID=33205 RepID=A0AAE8MMM9_9HYPO|nr:uncharacterized protein FTOL_13673 [Fusarium torulosum]